MDQPNGCPLGQERGSSCPWHLVFHCCGLSTSKSFFCSFLHSVLQSSFISHHRLSATLSRSALPTLHLTAVKLENPTKKHLIGLAVSLRRMQYGMFVCVRNVYVCRLKQKLENGLVNDFVIALELLSSPELVWKVSLHVTGSSISQSCDNHNYCDHVTPLTLNMHTYVRN